MVASATTFRQTHRTLLSNGITLIVTENPTVDLVAARLFFPQAGGHWESAAQAGLFHLLTAVMAKGTRSFSAVEIADQVESMGANLNVSAASDYVALSLKSVTSDFQRIFELAAEIMRYPTFPGAEVELERKITLQNIRSQQEQPFNVAYNLFRTQMYPNHPYGLSILGTPDSVIGFSTEEISQAHHTYFRPDNLIISISGRITLEQAESIVTQYLGSWKNPRKPLPVSTLPTLEPVGGLWQQQQETQQTIVMLGYLGVPISDPDFFSLKLLSNYLGNGLSSRLFVELREKQGLAYDVSALFSTRRAQSPFLTYIGTAPHNTAIALQGLHQEIQRLMESPLPAKDVQITKNKMLGQYALGKQTNAELAQIFGWYESIGLGLSFDQRFNEMMRAITATDLHRAAQKHFQNSYQVVVGPGAALSLIESLELS